MVIGQIIKRKIDERDRKKCQTKEIVMLKRVWRQQLLLGFLPLSSEKLIVRWARSPCGCLEPWCWPASAAKSLVVGKRGRPDVELFFFEGECFKAEIRENILKDI